MTQPSWSLAQGPNSFQNSFNQFFQMGRQIKQGQEQKERQNALAAYVTDPNDQTLAAVAPHAPQLVLQHRKDQRAAEAKAQRADIGRRAAAGDQGAMAELAGIDLNAWRGLSADQQKQFQQANDVMGNAAFQVGQLPPEQQAAAWDQQIDILSQQFPSLQKYKGQYSPQLLQSALNSAEMAKQFFDSQQPNYKVIPAGGTAVNTRDPQAMQQFGQSQPTQIQDTAGYDALPPGTKYIDPQGNVRTKSGGPSQSAAGGFR